MDARPATTNALESLSDFELVAKINDGDEAAFTTLYHRHKDWVVNLAFRFTNDRDFALDVLQETFAYVAAKFPGFRLTSRFTTFLYPAVRNLSLTAVRKANRLETGEHAQSHLETQPATDSPSSDDDLLRAVLAGLTEEHREVLQLRFVEGFDLREIAEAMEIPLGTVKSRLHNALQILRADDRTEKLFKP